MARRTHARLSDIWPSEARPWSAYWRDHARVVRDTTSYLVRRFATTLLVWVMIGIALALPAGLHLVEVNLALVAGEWRDRPGLSAYFEPGVDAQEPLALVRRLRGTAGIDRVWLITPDDALAEFRSLSTVGDALELLDDNPLPATVRATVVANVSPGRLSALREWIAQTGGVQDVVVERDWLERLSAIRDVVTRLSRALAGVLGLGAVLISSAAVRLAIEARLEEVKVLAMVGAGKRYVRRPFLYLGIVYGLGGASGAAMALSALLLWLEDPLERLFGSYGRDLELAGFDPTFYVVLLMTGAVLGTAGALVASNQRFRALKLA